MEGCVFCAMVAGKIPVAQVYEDDVVLAFLDIGPVSDGHTLVIPKQHVAKIHECKPELLAQVAQRLGRVAGAVAGAMKADGYNVLCNNGRAAGQVVDRVHFHIIPRRSGDGVLTEWPAYKYEKGRIEELASKIRDKLAGA
jgi:histidine triad (HIT) family protein